MKKINIKVIAGCILSTLFAVSSFGQMAEKNVVGNKKVVAKVEKSKVPQKVRDIWVSEYPESIYDSWYGYPAYNDYLSNWYYDWDNYDFNPYVSTEIPEDYVVEYTLNHVPYKSIYDKNGKKIATHKKLSSGLPVSIAEAISRGEYKSWKVGEDKEEIFKDKDSDQLKVYKIDVSKGEEKHVLYFQADGTLLKDKSI